MTLTTFLNSAYHPFREIDKMFTANDLLFRNLFDSNSTFDSVFNSKLNYPVDISEVENGLLFEVAVVGLDKKDVSIKVDGTSLRISYTKKNKQMDEPVYIHKGISRRSFDFSFRVSNRYDLSRLRAKMDKGLLTIEVPFSPSSELKEVKID
jgi:HSP20 family molecular chaperone IbpA